MMERPLLSLRAEAMPFSNRHSGAMRSIELWRNCAPENLEIPDRRFASSGMTPTKQIGCGRIPPSMARDLLT
jgi:hypothetical protein